MSPELYAPLYLYIVILLTIVFGYGAGNNYIQIKADKHNLLFACIISILFALWLGFRPITPHFGDTISYAHKFDLLQLGRDPNFGKGELLFAEIMTFFADRYDVSIYFTFIDLLYFGFTLWACQRFTPNNPLVMLLFVMGAFSFYSYGINGIRNGLACSIVLAAISFLNGKKINILIALILSYCAFHIHRSTALPILMSFVSYFFLRSSYKWSILFWLFSIFVSLTLGSFIENIFVGLGFDDRMTKYMSGENEGFERSGFRWDFLLYSAMPILLGYYTVIKRGIQNKTYLLLLNTYTLSNAFWVMIIRASFSNRFAYLSWFMYPVVLAYPLLKLDIWGEEQGRRLRQIMLAQVGFTWFMDTFFS